MKKYLLSAVLSLAGLSAAHAEPRVWHFTYRGFVDAATGVFNPQMELKGEFVGEDRNADGVVTLDELSYFESQGHRFLPKVANPGGSGCGSHYLSCSVYNFSYALTGQLDYTVGTHGADEFYNRWWFSDTVTGSHFSQGSGDIFHEENWVSRYNWSDKTTFSMLSVPEPTTALMLPAGLALMYWVRARRRTLFA
ncbi:MAG: PEP-CTERM sorting domain-containing protein [Janthinobacterium sp.]|uniref:PEP-CTERM sorting domain-containing protein n=1 Tax=Janthinobacterium sp. TND4EL3 TaxID=1907311 RepID=UPI000954C1DF|nr:PEP-CTERM sorting domain-containing protein [Janthinobacterium sp. TND4EL3]SIP95236.1 PEP-CTERM protein-sorting domain-containing protein [Janthinobacterium sp. TND4EL3]